MVLFIDSFSVMPTPLPSSVRERWGEEVADDFSR
jgi:hypothetical protein